MNPEAAFLGAFTHPWEHERAVSQTHHPANIFDVTPKSV